MKMKSFKKKWCGVMLAKGPFRWLALIVLGAACGVQISSALATEDGPAPPGLLLLLTLEQDRVTAQDLVALDVVPRPQRQPDGWRFAVLDGATGHETAARLDLSPPGDPSQILTVRLAWPTVGSVGELRAPDGRTVYRILFDDAALSEARGPQRAGAKSALAAPVLAAQREQVRRQMEASQSFDPSERHQAPDEAVSSLATRLGHLPDLDLELAKQQLANVAARDRSKAIKAPPVPLRPLDWPDPKSRSADAVTGTTINGQLRGPNGESILNTWVYFYDTGGQYLAAFHSGSNGQLAVDLAGGDYKVSATGPVPLIPVSQLPLTLVNGFEIQLERGVQFDYRLVDDDGAPLNPDPAPTVCAYAAWDQNAAMTHVGASCAGSASGSLALLADQPYTLNVFNLPAPYAFNSLSISRSSDGSQDIVVGMGNVIALMGDDGTPITETWIGFYASDYSYLRSDYTGADGEILSPLPPGDYLIHTVPLAPWVGQAWAPVTLVADQPLIIELERGLTATVSLRDAQGEVPQFDPAPNICVYPDWDQNVAMTYVPATCFRGSLYDFAVLSDRTYRVEVFDLVWPNAAAPQHFSLQMDGSVNVSLVEGRVASMTSGGAALRDTRVWIDDPDGNFLRRYHSNPDGQFLTDLTPGPYLITVSSPTEFLNWYRRPVELPEAGEWLLEFPEGVSIALELPAEVGSATVPGALCAYPIRPFLQGTEGLQTTCATLSATDAQLTMFPGQSYRTYGSGLGLPWILLPETLRYVRADAYTVPVAEGVGIEMNVAVPNSAQSGFSVNGQWPAGTRYDVDSETLYAPAEHAPFVVNVRPDDPDLFPYTEPPRVYESGDRIDVVLKKRGTLSGVVTDDAGEPAVAYVRVFQNGEYVAGTRSGFGDGSYSMTVPRGVYEIRVTQSAQQCCSYLYRPTHVVSDVAVGEAKNLDIQFEETLVNVKVEGPEYRQRVELRQGDELLGINYSDRNGGFDVLPGVYDLTIEMPGYRPWTYNGIDLTEARTITLPQRNRKIWQGRLLTEDEAPIEGSTVRVFDATQRNVWHTQTAADGGFLVPTGAGYTVTFAHPRTGSLARELHTVELANRTDDVVLESLSFTPLNSDLAKIYSGGAPDPYKVIILAAGYAEQAEQFTDVNGNGVWDGVLYFDLNGNGVWDNSPYENLSIYGDRPYPTAGEDPSADNEPFEDLNGDGYPSFGGRAVFEKNVQTFVRDWMSADFWRDNQDKFEVHAFFQDSPQEGMDVIDVDGQTVLVERDTTLDAALYRNRSLLGIDYAEAINTAASVLPDYDGIVVMINQPIGGGRANSFQLYYGGINGPVNSNVPSHEYGHSVGRLADEYSEFPTNFVFDEPWARHVTKFHREENLPWQMDPENTTFTLPFAEGVGHFEGAVYHQGSAFRPTDNSTMRYNANHFNRPSVNMLWENAPFAGSIQTVDADLDGDGADEWVLRDRRSSALVIGGHANHGAVSGELSDSRWGPDWTVVGAGPVSAGGPDVLIAREALTGKYRAFSVGAELTNAGMRGMPTPISLEPRVIGHFNDDGVVDALVQESSNRKWKLYTSSDDGLWRKAGTLPFLFRTDDWAFTSAGDFNGDGLIDVLFRATNGKWRQFQLDGTQMISRLVTKLPKTSTTRWVATGDFTGDGLDDILLTDANDNFLVAATKASGLIGKARTVRGLEGLAYEQSVRGVGDYSGDGVVQALVRNRDTGEWGVFTFAGATGNRGTYEAVDLPGEGWMRH